MIEYLIEQCKHPTGFVGRGMIGIWNRVFHRMTLWGLANFPVREGDVILDIGCGGGQGIETISRSATSLDIYGIDISLTAVKKAQKYLAKKNFTHSINIQQASVLALPFPDNKFHKVFAIQTHFYWEEIEKAVTLIYNVIQAQGSFTIICEKAKLPYHLPVYVSQASTTNLLREAGFQDIQIYETNKWIQYCCKK